MFTGDTRSASSLSGAPGIVTGWRVHAVDDGPLEPDVVLLKIRCCPRPSGTPARCHISSAWPLHQINEIG
jgi:hypothetical protein